MLVAALSSLFAGCERRVIFDFVNVIQEECTLGQALIQDRRNSNLYLLAASQTKDKVSIDLTVLLALNF